jgi:hypothetical protein
LLLHRHRLDLREGSGHLGEETSAGLDLGCHAERVVGILFLGFARGNCLAAYLSAVGFAGAPRKGYDLLDLGFSVADSVFSSLAADAAGSGVHLCQLLPTMIPILMRLMTIALTLTMIDKLAVRRASEAIAVICSGFMGDSPAGL